MYDAIVVGARCAGSPMAMLLARAGRRVLVLDRSTFPSDIMSTHFIHPWGLAYLQRWGLLDRVRASGCPPIPHIRMGIGRFVASNPVEPRDGVTEALCPRRTVLDTILVDAAVAAGAELREGFSVQEVLMQDGAVTGIRGRDRNGEMVTEHARIVVGADGKHSLVAHAVDAPAYHMQPTLTCGYYAYWSGVPVDGAEIYLRNGRAILLFATNDGLTCIGIEWPDGEFAEFKRDIEGSFMKTLALVPGLAERIRAGQREERYIGVESPNYFRKPYGPGWALVGDAGYYKDPITGTGISDAFRDAQLLADALVAAFSGRAPFPSTGSDGGSPQTFDEALADYEQRRNEAALPLYQQTIALASLPPPAELLRTMAQQTAR